MEDGLQAVLALVAFNDFGEAGGSCTGGCEAIDELDREVSVDSGIVPAHPPCRGLPPPGHALHRGSRPPLREQRTR
jgi:hypothetical protein